MKKILQATVFLSLIIVLSSYSQSRLLPVDTSNYTSTDSLSGEKAFVYLFRKSLKYPAQGLRVDIDNIELATFYPKKFYTCTLNPGKYVFTAHALNDDEITLDLEKGKKYYIEVAPKLGMVIANCKLELIDPSEGEKIVQKCTLIDLNKKTQEPPK